MFEALRIIASRMARLFVASNNDPYRQLEQKEIAVCRPYARELQHKLQLLQKLRPDQEKKFNRIIREKILQQTSTHDRQQRLKITLNKISVALQPELNNTQAALVKPGAKEVLPMSMQDLVDRLRKTKREFTNENQVLVTRKNTQRDRYFLPSFAKAKSSSGAKLDTALSTSALLKRLT